MITDILKNNLDPKDKFIYGTADLSGLINKQFCEYEYGVSIGKGLDDNIVNKVENGPTLEYYRHYKQINQELSDKAHHIKKLLRNIGINSKVIEPTTDTQSEEFQTKYRKTLTLEVSHKMVATRAGLGWIGKTDLFVSEIYGPRLRLVSLLIDKKPELVATPIEESKCGKCNICVNLCPAKAANGKLWNKYIHRDVFFDAQKCWDKCGELALDLLGNDQRICGLCVAVCPFGKKMLLTFLD